MNKYRVYLYWQPEVDPICDHIQEVEAMDEEEAQGAAVSIAEAIHDQERPDGCWIVSDVEQIDAYRPYSQTETVDDNADSSYQPYNVSVAQGADSATFTFSVDYTAYGDLDGYQDLQVSSGTSDASSWTVANYDYTPYYASETEATETTESTYTPYNGGTTPAAALQIL